MKNQNLSMDIFNPYIHSVSVRRPQLPSIPDSIGQPEFQSTNVSENCDTATCNQNSTGFFSESVQKKSISNTDHSYDNYSTIRLLADSLFADSLFTDSLFTVAFLVRSL